MRNARTAVILAFPKVGLAMPPSLLEEPVLATDELTQPTTYRGYVTAEGEHVVLVTDPLGIAHQLKPDQSLFIRVYSWGFHWGSSGHAATQLALAMLFDVLDERVLADELADLFRTDFVSDFGDDWEITAAEIAHWAAVEMKGGAA